MIQNRRFLYVLILLEALLCALIIHRVSYTEIDWKTYIQQANLVFSGERDYSLIKGDSGPLVYPAGHVFIYALISLLLGDEGDVRTGQWLFAGIYLTSLVLVGLIYARSTRIPGWIIGLLVISKRLHSIYVLRMFNDGGLGFDSFNFSSCNAVSLRILAGTLS
jgi:alpha-1,3-mannosyltransferase